MKEKETSKLYNSLTNVDNQFIEEAQTKAKKKEGWLKWGAIVACLFLVVSFISIPRPIKDEPTSGDLAPMVYVNDTLYQIVDNPPDFTDKQNEFIYLGEITSKVSSSQEPKEEFQSNDDFVGAKVYQFGDDIIVMIDDNYWLFEAINKKSSMGETVEFHGKLYNKADLSEETLEWLEWYNSLSSDEQLSINSVPNELYSFDSADSEVSPE